MKRTLAICLFGFFALPAAAHEFWIDTDKWQVQPGETIEGSLRNGENFEGANLAYFSRRIERFDRLHDGEFTALEGRDGDNPAIRIEALDEGLNVLGYVSAVSRVTYDDFAKFMRFVDHKDLGPIRTLHANRGLPAENFSEAYTRYVKALYAVGDGVGEDAAFGFAHELIALDNPYTDDLQDGMRVALERDGARRGDVQIELFERNPEGAVAITLHRTDAEGVAVLPVKPGHTYLVDAVILFEPSPERAEQTNTVWETDWASLTFAVPG